MENPRILVALDFSPASERALDLAVDFARRSGGSLDLLHVWQPPIDLTPEMVALPAAAYDDSPARAELQKRLERVRAAGIGQARAQLVHGPPSAGIVQRAAENHSDLIVMGTHGRRGLAHLVLGSVAEHVVRTAPCPVLTTR